MAGMTGMGLSAAALIVSAIMRFAVSAQGKGFNITKIGLILMFAGAIGFVVSSVLLMITRNGQAATTHTMHSETSDSKGNSVVQDKVQN
jgi:mannitol-specific phosphotransferase system IIBC component